MDKLLQQAIDALQINDVYQIETSAKLAPGFVPALEDELDNFTVQAKHLVRRFEVIDVERGEDKFSLVRFFVEFGARFVPKGVDLSAVKDEQIRAHIEATFVAEYRMDGDLEKAALNTFALRNTSFHVWPYWREYLSAQCQRMNLPKLVLPTVQVAKNPKNKQTPPEN